MKIVKQESTHKIMSLLECYFFLAMVALDGKSLLIIFAKHLRSKILEKINLRK